MIRPSITLTILIFALSININLIARALADAPAPSIPPNQTNPIHKFKREKHHHHVPRPSHHQKHSTKINEDEERSFFALPHDTLDALYQMCETVFDVSEEAVNECKDVLDERFAVIFEIPMNAHDVHIPEHEYNPPMHSKYTPCEECLFTCRYAEEHMTPTSSDDECLDFLHDACEMLTDEASREDCHWVLYEMEEIIANGACPRLRMGVPPEEICQRVCHMRHRDPLKIVEEMRKHAEPIELW